MIYTTKQAICMQNNGWNWPKWMNISLSFFVRILIQCVVRVREQRRTAKNFSFVFLHLNFDCCNADWDFLLWDKNICETHRWLARSFTFVCKNRFIIDAIFFFSQKFPFILDVIDNIFTVTMADYKTKRLVIAWQVAHCVIRDAWILYIILHKIHKIVLYALFNYNGNT